MPVIRAVALALVLVGSSCAPATTALPTESAAPTPTATLASPTATASPAGTPSRATAAEFTPKLLLTLRYSPDADALGASTARVGGLSAKGVTSFAVDDRGEVYIWDRARLRIEVYDGMKLLRALAVPYVEQDANSLLVENERLYLEYVGSTGFGAIQYEIDSASGRLLRAVTGASIYPRERYVDAFGMRYAYDGTPPIQAYMRSDASGKILAYAVEPLATKGVSLYARRDGTLYELASDWGGQGSAYVYELLPPVGTPPPPSAPGAPVAPVAFGRTMPASLSVGTPPLGSVDLDEPTRTAIWWLASLATPRSGTYGSDGVSFVAKWDDGSIMHLSAGGYGLSSDAQQFVTPTQVWSQLASFAGSSPARLSALARSAPVRIRITDLPSTDRPLSASQVDELVGALSSAFAVSQAELPGDLEVPFPEYEIAIGDLLVQLRHDRYAALGRLGAFAHDGSLYALAQRAVPVPSLPASDPRSLFLATSVTIEDESDPSAKQDISRWKATIVRTLTLASSGGGYQWTKPLVLTFAFADGRTERVPLTLDGYTYRGIFYPRGGALGDIAGLRGVP